MSSANGELKVTVLDIKGGKVKLGFEVDAAIPVHRWEVWERICAMCQPDNPEEEGRVQSLEG